MRQRVVTGEDPPWSTSAGVPGSRGDNRGGGCPWGCSGWERPGAGCAVPLPRSPSDEAVHLRPFLIPSRLLPPARPSPRHGLLPCPGPLPLSQWPHSDGACPVGDCHHRDGAAGRDLPGCPRADSVSPLPASHHHQDQLRDRAHELPSWLLLLLCGVGAASRDVATLPPAAPGRGWSLGSGPGGIGQAVGHGGGRGTEVFLGQQVGSWGDCGLLPGAGKVPRPKACCCPWAGAGAVCSRAALWAAGALRCPLLGSAGKVLASPGRSWLGPCPHAAPRTCPGSRLCLSLCSRCDLCCCLIPCLFDDFKDVTHTCPNCKAYIYTYKRMC